MKLIIDTICELERQERVNEYDFAEAIGLLHQANKAYNKALFIHSVAGQSEQLPCDFYDHDKQIDVEGVCDKCGSQKYLDH